MSLLGRIWRALPVLALGLVWPAAAWTQQTHPDSTRADSVPRYQLQSITVTAAPTRALAPQSARTIPAPVLQRTLATSGSTWELLRQAAGLEVHQQGQGPGFASDAAVRGFSSDHSTDLALWIDGVPVNEPVNGHAEGYSDWSLLFPQSVEELEVIKGPTSPFFGNFALAGVVNVRTVARMRGSRLWLSGGSEKRVEAVGMTGFDHPDAGGVLGARFQHEGGWRPNSAWSLGQAYGRWVRDFSDAVSIDGGVNLYGARWDSPGFLTLEQYRATNFDVVSDPTDGGFKRRAQERVSARVRLTPALLWRSTAYATQGRWQLFFNTPPEGGEEEGSGRQTEEEDRRYGFGLTSALSWLARSTELTIGTQNRLDHADYENWFTTARVRAEPQQLVRGRQLAAGLFLDGARDLGRLRLEVGARWDLLANRAVVRGEAPVTGSHGIFSPKLGALLLLGPDVRVYGNASRGFRQPDGVLTEPDLPFITEWAYETGVKWLHGENSLALAVFRMDVSNEQSFNPVTLETTSGGASRRDGAELEATLHPTDRLALRADLTLNDAAYRELITAEGDRLSGARIFNTARYVGDAAADLTVTTSLMLRLGANVVGPYTPFDEPEVSVDPYALLHGGATVQLGSVQLQAGIRNLLDRTYPELRAGGFVSPGAPRSVNITVHAQLQ